MPTFRQYDLSGGIQTATTRILSKPNELETAHNGIFNRLIGACSRRNGYVRVSTHTAKPTLGAFSYSYDGGSNIFRAANASDDSVTNLSYLNGSWTDILSVDPGTKMRAQNYLGELYVVGSGSTFMDPVNINSSFNVSTSRNVYGMPRAKMIAEFRGSLIAINCEVNVGGAWKKYPNRAYISSTPTGVITYVKGDQSGTLTVIELDSVRYLKAGMEIDIYTGGTETKIYTVTISSVDKVNNTITVASSSYTLQNRDEIWLKDRKGQESILWNTDYPSTENADFIYIASGEDEFAEFTAVARTSARLFLFTKNSIRKFDGQNFVPVSTKIGSLSHECTQVIGNWVIFPHTSGLYGYNDSTGQLKLLSRGVKSWWKSIPEENWANASAGVIDNIYKIWVGDVNYPNAPGSLRLDYDFDMNVFATEFHKRDMPFQFLFTYQGQTRLHFMDNNGGVFVDDEGNLDDTDTIPFEVKMGRNNQTVDSAKTYVKLWVYTTYPQGAKVSYSIDNGEFVSLGQLRKDVQELFFNEGEGYDIDIKITHNDAGPPIDILEVATEFNTVQS